MNAADPATVWTIGHSTRTLEEFLALLAAHAVEAIADVRRFPGSRRWPQFARWPITNPRLLKSTKAHKTNTHNSSQQ